MPPLVDNLGARITIILLAGFAALQLAIVAVVAWPVHGRSPLFELPLPEETSAMIDALEASPAAARPLVVRALNTSTVTVRLAGAFPPLDPQLREAVGFEKLFRLYSPVLAHRAFRVDERRHPALRAFGLRGAGARPDAPLRLSVRLGDGAVLVLERRPPIAVRSYIARMVMITGSITLTLIAVLIVAVRQTTRPVAELARAVRRFADEMDAPDLAERGPREISDLAAAFNEMKANIRGLVDQRTRMLAAVAHDLRTYLTRLRLRAEFIDDPVQRSKAAGDLDEMSALLDDTLMFARDATVRAAGAEPIDIGQEVAAFVAVRRELGEPVTQVESAPDRLMARCSRLALRRMLANLADNAIRYGSAAHVAARAAAGGVEITVEDDGPGVPEGDLARLAEPFERLEPSRGRATGGAGLGLAIVRALAESQGGRLSLRNREGGGLAASVWLPI